MKIREGRSWFWRRSFNIKSTISNYENLLLFLVQNIFDTDNFFSGTKYFRYRYRYLFLVPIFLLPIPIPFFQYQRCILQIKVIILHLFDFSPLYVYKCVLKSPASEEAYSHWLHLFDLIPLCLFMCPLKSLGPGTRVQWLKLWKWGMRWLARLVMRKAPQSSDFSSSCPCLWCGEMRLSWTTATLKGVMMMLPGESLIPLVPVIYDASTWKLLLYLSSIPLKAATQ